MLSTSFMKELLAVPELGQCCAVPRTPKYDVFSDAAPEVEKALYRNYKIRIKTGKAGTYSKVKIAFVGEQGTSERVFLGFADTPRPEEGEDFVPIFGSNESLFKLGQTDEFDVMIKTNIGRLQSVILSHSNTGMFPRWHVERLEIEDGYNALTYVCPCDDWIESASANGEIVYEKKLNCLEHSSKGQTWTNLSSRTVMGPVLGFRGTQNTPTGFAAGFSVTLVTIGVELCPPLTAQLGTTLITANAKHLKTLSGQSLWRFDFDVPLVSVSQICRYTIPDGRSFDFEVCGFDTVPNTAFVGDKKFQKNRNLKSFDLDSTAVFEHISNHHSRSNFNLLIFGGGAIKPYRAFCACPSLLRWASLSVQERKSHPFTEEMQDEIETYFFFKYVNSWGDEKLANILSVIPSHFVISDEDVLDGWGDRPYSHIAGNIFKIGIQNFILFAHMALRIESHFIHTVTSATVESDAGPFTTVLKYGTLGLVCLDTVTQRDPTGVLSVSAWKQLSISAGNILKNSTYVLCVSPSPILSPSPSSLLKIFDFGKRERTVWESPLRTYDRNALIDFLFEISSVHRCRVAVLSAAANPLNLKFESQKGLTFHNFASSFAISQSGSLLDENDIGFEKFVKLEKSHDVVRVSGESLSGFQIVSAHTTAVAQSFISISQLPDQSLNVSYVCRSDTDSPDPVTPQLLPPPATFPVVLHPFALGPVRDFGVVPAAGGVSPQETQVAVKQAQLYKNVWNEPPPIKARLPVRHQLQNTYNNKGAEGPTIANVATGLPPPRSTPHPPRLYTSAQSNFSLNPSLSPTAPPPKKTNIFTDILAGLNLFGSEKPSADRQGLSGSVPAQRTSYPPMSHGPTSAPPARNISPARHISPARNYFADIPPNTSTAFVSYSDPLTHSLPPFSSPRNAHYPRSLSPVSSTQPPPLQPMPLNPTPQPAPEQQRYLSNLPHADLRGGTYQPQPLPPPALPLLQTMPVSHPNPPPSDSNFAALHPSQYLHPSVYHPHENTVSYA